MSDFTALYDACVLYPAPLRDFLLRLAITGLYRARWTDQIHDEWIESLLANRPDLNRAQLERTRALMNAHVQDCLVSDYEQHIEDLDLPDPDDRHVLAAAIQAQASVIVTFNLEDFPSDSLEPYAIEVQHPDVFISRLFQRSSTAVCEAARLQRAALQNPPRSVEEFLDALARQGLDQTVDQLRQVQELI